MCSLTSTTKYEYTIFRAFVDSDYIKFVESLNTKDDGEGTLTMEQVLEEIEAKEKASKGAQTHMAISQLLYTCVAVEESTL